jgi:DNA-binding NarL/FixJ family response regulator
VTSTIPAVVRRVLLVDDSDLWRRSIRSIFEAQSFWQIVGEASDGWDAIEQVERLDPGLILLDVALPRLNGIETAGRLLERTRAPKILFMSAHTSPDIADAALATGAHGYLLKGDVGSELLRAMEIVARGKRFVSTQLAGRLLA